MTDCADSTALRAHLDHTDRPLDAHLDTCDACAGLLRSVAADAGYARQRLAVLDADVAPVAAPAVEAALDAARRRAAPRVDPTAAARHRSAPVGRRVALVAAALVAVILATVTPTGRSALADALDAFRGERLQPVMVDIEALRAAFGPEERQALAALGEVDTSRLAEPEEVAGASEAEDMAGITAPTTADAPDRYVALAPGTVRLVLATRPGNGVPADLDGAALVVDVPGAIGAIYGPADGLPEVVVGRSGALVVRSEGASLERIRSFVLSRPELPAQLRTQLGAIRDWRTTIPVPVPLDGPGWKEVEVAGRQAIAFGDDTGLGALVIRHDAAGVTVVGGRIGITRAMELAARA